jgi:hypothetical protein
VKFLLLAKDLLQVKEVVQRKHLLAQKVQLGVDNQAEVLNYIIFFCEFNNDENFLVDELSELSANPQFQALRQLIQQNPDQLQTLMQTLQATQPELFQVNRKCLSGFLIFIFLVD